MFLKIIHFKIIYNLNQYIKNLKTNNKKQKYSLWRSSSSPPTAWEFPPTFTSFRGCSGWGSPSLKNWGGCLKMSTLSRTLRRKSFRSASTRTNSWLTGRISRRTAIRGFSKFSRFFFFNYFFDFCVVLRLCSC